MGINKLIKGCIKGDIKSQEKLYHLLAPKLFAVSLKYCKNKEEAEDNLQNAFITLFQKIDQFQFKGSFEGWAKRIAINSALQTYRKPQVLELVNQDNIAPSREEIEYDEDQLHIDFLLQCIQELPDRYRLVFNLYALDHYSHQEIAEMLNISVGTSKSNLARARQLLKTKIERQTQAPDRQNTTYEG